MKCEKCGEYLTNNWLCPNATCEYRLQFIK